MADITPLSAGFLDRLGDRVRAVDDKSTPLEILRLRPDLTAGPLFESAVRRRTDQLASFDHPNCARVHRVGRLPAPDGRLVIVSDAIDGWRLSEVLEAISESGVAVHPDAVLFLLRQLLDAVTALHNVGPGISHGALGTERLVVTADGRLVVTETVLGGALRYLPTTTPDRLWRDYRLAVASGEALPFGRLTDLRQIGVVALSLALGRQVRRDEYPGRLAALVQPAAAASPARGDATLGPAFWEWLARVLSLTDMLTQWSVAEAQRELARVAETDAGCSFAPTGLVELMGTVASYYEAPAADAAPAAQAVPAAPAVPASWPASREPVAPPAPGEPVAPAMAAEPVAPTLPVEMEFEPAAAVEIAAPTVREAADALVMAPPPMYAAEPAPALGAEPEAEAVQVSVEIPAPADVPRYQPPSPPSEFQLFATPPMRVAASAVAPLADAVGGDAPAASDSRGDDRRRTAPRASVTPPSGRIFDIQVADDEMEAVAESTGSRTKVLLAVGAAALVVIALGGYVALRPPSAAAKSDQREQPAVSAPTNPSAPAPIAAASPTVPAPTAKAPAPAPATPPAAAPAAAAPENAPKAGAIDVVSAVSLNLSEGGRALGTSGAPVALAPGRHAIELVREDLGYRSVETVDIKPGQTTRIQPALPSGAANLNAVPWAEVWIDGQKVGETPLGQVPLTIGAHEVQFRHPDFETQTKSVVVAVGTVTRISVEFKK